MSERLEQAQALLLGYQQLRDNPLYVSVINAIKTERDASFAVILSGEFPTDTGDLKGVLYREQQIGESRGLTRIVGFLDAVINKLEAEVRELQAQQEEESKNET